jgi:hypothetical protein
VDHPNSHGIAEYILDDTISAETRRELLLSFLRKTSAQ